MKTKVQPANDPSGAPFVVYNPATGRNIAPEGEFVTITPHLERRILAGELVRAPELTPPTTPTRSRTGAPAAKPETQE